MIYRKLKRTWSHNNANYIPTIKEAFPELKNISSEELCDRLIKAELEFYTDNRENCSSLVRFTLPFAVILFLLMLISIPILFMITGKWGYGFSEKNYVYNWFKKLRLL